MEDRVRAVENKVDRVDERLGKIDDSLKELVALNQKNAHILYRLDESDKKIHKIENNLSKVVFMVISAVVVAVMGLILKH